MMMVMMNKTQTRPRRASSKHPPRPKPKGNGQPIRTRGPLANGGRVVEGSLPKALGDGRRPVSAAIRKKITHHSNKHPPWPLGPRLVVPSTLHRAPPIDRPDFFGAGGWRVLANLERRVRVND